MEPTLNDIRRLVNLWKEDPYSSFFITSLIVTFIYFLGAAVDFWNATSASWVQAIGSIGAILFAYWWGVGQESRATTRQLIIKCEEQAEDLLAALEIAKSINAKIIKCRAMSAFNFYNEKASIRNLLQALNEIPLHQRPFSMIAEHLISYTNSIDEVNLTVDRYHHLGENHMDINEEKIIAESVVDFSILKFEMLEKNISKAKDIIRIRTGF